MALALSAAGSSARAVLASLVAPQARCYAASAASAAMRRSAAEGSAAGSGDAKEAAAEVVAWVPDPVTGHYRPSNFSAAVDPADLRAALARTYARA